MYGSGIWIFLFLSAGSAEALPEGGLCYVLDGILIIYGIVLTFLYCRLRWTAKKNEKMEDTKEDLYQDLRTAPQDTYETLHLKKQAVS